MTPTQKSWAYEVLDKYGHSLYTGDIAYVDADFEPTPDDLMKEALDEYAEYVHCGYDASDWHKANTVIAAGVHVRFTRSDTA